MTAFHGLGVYRGLCGFCVSPYGGLSEPKRVLPRPQLVLHLRNSTTLSNWRDHPCQHGGSVAACGVAAVPAAGTGNPGYDLESQDDPSAPETGSRRSHASVGSLGWPARSQVVVRGTGGLLSCCWQRRLGRWGLKRALIRWQAPYCAATAPLVGAYRRRGAGRLSTRASVSTERKKPTPPARRRPYKKTIWLDVWVPPAG